MKIKQSYQSSYLQYIISILALIGLVILVNNLSRPNALISKKGDLPPTSKEIVQFLAEDKSFLEVLKQFEDFDIYLSVKDEASKEMPQSLRDTLLKMGGKEISKLGYRQSYVGMLRAGQFKKEKRSKKKPAILEIGSVVVSSAGSELGDFCSFKIENKTIQGYKRGLHIFVLNPNNYEVFHYKFDFFKEANPTASGNILNQASDQNEAIEIILDQKFYNKLETKRNEAIKSQILLTSEEDFVPAKVAYKGKIYPVTLRLKGDWTDHLGKKKWSFRIKMEGEETLKGMRKFSLHHPKARNYLGEWIFHQMLQKEDVLNLQYEFLNVQMTVKNGLVQETEEWGLYALEESFDKYLLERNKRREGVILKIDESPMWEERLKYLEGGLSLSGIPGDNFGKYDELPIIPFNEKKIIKDSSLHKQLIAGRNLLDAFLKREIKVSEAFDVERLARFNALCNLLGGTHAINLHNVRLYFNPINQKLEPIGFDAIGWKKTHWAKIFYEGKSDPLYMAAYGAALERMRTKEYEKSILNLPGLNEHWLKLKQAYPEFYFDDKLLKTNRNTIRNKLYPSHCLNVFLENYEDNQLELMVEHYGQFPSIISGLAIQESRIIAKPIGENIISPGEKKIMTFGFDKNFQKLFVSKKSKRANFQIDKDLEKLKLVYNAAGTQNTQIEDILPWAARQKAFENTAPYQKEPNHTQFDFLITDEIAKTITWKSGSWELTEPLFIPQGYTFYINGGTQITIDQFQKSITSRSPVHFEGTADNPIEFISNSGYGEGLFVLETGDTSILNHCIFDGLRNVSSFGWLLSGSINFYNAPVKIHNTLIKNNHSEDALNIIRSGFELENVTFSETESDAFDGDFVEGTIRNSIFGNIGNDGIDVSGSNVFIENVKIVGAGDKGLSGGEASTLTVKNVEIADSEIAVAGKDQSEMKLEGVLLKNNKLGFTAFQKKSEFGFAHIIADGVELLGNKEDYLIEVNSSLKLNGKEVKTSSKVKERMYGVEFGKASN